MNLDVPVEAHHHPPHDRAADCKITTINALDFALLNSVSPPHQPALALRLSRTDAPAYRDRRGPVRNS